MIIININWLIQDQNPHLRKNSNVPNQGQDQGQGQDQKWRQRSALQQQMVLALTLTLTLVQNIIIFSKVRVLVLNQPIIILLLYTTTTTTTTTNATTIDCIQTGFSKRGFNDLGQVQGQDQGQGQDQINGGSAARCSSKWSWS